MEGELFAHTLIRIGPLDLRDSLVTTWLIMLGLWLLSLYLSRAVRRGGGLAASAAEGLVSAMEDAVKAVLPAHAAMVLPFVMTLWIFLVAANLAGLVPGLHSPTRDPSVTAALAFLVFLSVHWFGIRARGLSAYLSHYLRPSPILLPFHVLGEITRTLALAVRLFGNMMSLEMAALLLLLVAGFLAPVPILMLHIVEALVQAYIFGMLALIYVAGGIQSQQPRLENKE
jgi:F-type H+-transporting ATPase subunit a